MTMLDLFSPFAQKYLLQKPRVECSERYLSITNTLRGMRTNIFVEFERNKDQLCTKNFLPIDTSAFPTIEGQLVWNNESIMDANRHYSAMHKDEWVEDQPFDENLKKWRNEGLAYYCSAHQHSSDQYGIYISRSGVASLAKCVHSFCPDQPIELIQDAAVYFLYAHQIGHAWIEEICCLIDFMHEVPETKERRQYSKIQSEFNGTILMEEIICNTVAYGFLQRYLFDIARPFDPKLPRHNHEIIFASFEQWMREYTLGYRNFYGIDAEPHENLIVIRNVYLLLSRIYFDKIDMNEWDIAYVLQIFFGCNLHNDCSYFEPRDVATSGALWCVQPPVYIKK